MALVIETLGLNSYLHNHISSQSIIEARWEGMVGMWPMQGHINNQVWPLSSHMCVSYTLPSKLQVHVHAGNFDHMHIPYSGKFSTFTDR